MEKRDALLEKDLGNGQFCCRNPRCSQTDLVQSESQQEGKRRSIFAELATQADPFAASVRTVDKLFQEPQESRVEGTVKLADLGILTVRGEKILGEVVLPDAEKVHFGTQLLENEGYGRHL